MKNNRLKWIDAAKGICMLAVVAGHLGVVEIDNIVFSFHLTVYFILSGYTLKNDLSVQTLNNKFKRLMIPYFITCIAVSLMDTVNMVSLYSATDVYSITGRLGFNLTRGFIASGFFSNLGAVDIGGRIGAVWFLPAIFFAIVITQLLLKYVSDKKLRFIISGVLAVLAVCSSQFIWLPFSIQSALLATPLMLLGFEAKEKELDKKISFKHFVVCLGVFAAAVLLGKAAVYYVSADMQDILISPVSALASSVCIIYISKKAEKCKPLIFIGKNSLYFLCVHLFEIETMGVWFEDLMGLLHVPYNSFTLYILKILFISLTVGIILLIKKAVGYIGKEGATIPATKRDTSLDIAKAVLIIAMIIGHFPIDARLRNVIYGFHMMAFIIYSGYLFDPESCGRMVSSVLRLIKSFLLPYAVFCIGYVVLMHDGFLRELKTVLFGMSFSKNILTDILSVGPVYFLLLLFSVRLVYLIICRLIKNEIVKCLAVVTLSLIGVSLGENGVWLPWSFDCALYSLIFYHAGYCLKKYNIMDFFVKRSYSYFLLASVFSYMVYSGGAELAIRNYGKFGLVVLGALSASVLLYMLAKYLCDTLPRAITSLLAAIGRSTLYILIVHTLLGSYIERFADGLSLTPGYLNHFVVVVTINIALGTLIGVAIKLLSKMKRPF